MERLKIVLENQNISILQLEEANLKLKKELQQQKIHSDLLNKVGLF